MEKIDTFKKTAIEMGYDPNQVEEFAKTLPSSEGVSPSFERQAVGMGYDPAQVSAFSSTMDQAGVSSGKYADMSGYSYPVGISDGVPLLTQPFGARNSRYNSISGGVNRGADFGLEEGTPLFAPKGGDWVVLDSYTGARGSGAQNPYYMDNDGYGNSVLMKNTKTGETVRMSHLSKVGVRPGQEVKGGTPIGLSGATGHVTGPHVDAEYINENGQLSDILQSPWAQQFYGAR